MKKGETTMLDVERITDRNHQQARFARDTQTKIEQMIVLEAQAQREDRRRAILCNVRRFLLTASMVLLGAGLASAGIAVALMEWRLFTPATVELGLCAVAYFFGTEV